MESTKKYFLLSILLLLFYVRIAEASIFIDKTKDFKNLDSGQSTLIIYSTDPNGNTIQYTYDALNRLVQKTYPDASASGGTTTYQYDAIGNLTSATNQYISYTFAYDALGRMTSVTDSLGKSISYAYDANSGFNQGHIPNKNWYQIKNK